MRFALSCLEKVAKPTGVATAEILHDHTSLIARVVVHHQNFPFNGLRQNGDSNALESLGQALAPVVRAQYYRNVHRLARSPPVARRRQPPTSNTITLPNAWDASSCYLVRPSKLTTESAGMV